MFEIEAKITFNKIPSPEELSILESGLEGLQEGMKDIIQSITLTNSYKRYKESLK